MSHSVMVVYGTRPEAIKLAPVIHALRAADDMRPYIVTTGQHPDLVRQAHALFSIEADEDIGAFVQGQSLDQLLGRMMPSLGEAVARVQPDVLLVQGDTTSCFAGAVAAFHANVRVVHLEAGMRSGDMTAPFPEEGYRRAVAQFSSLHLAASPASVAHLEREGIDPGTVSLVGSTGVDALQYMLRTHEPAPQYRQLLTGDHRLITVTCHRRESWGEPLQSVGEAIRIIAATHPDVRIVLPLHPNPIVRDVLSGLLKGFRNVTLTEPMDYASFTHLMARSDLLLTDSGGVQAEAPSLGVPVLVLRTTTEYPEAVEAGLSELVGTQTADIVAAAEGALATANVGQTRTSPYGDGTAAEKSVNAIRSLVEGSGRGQV